MSTANPEARIEAQARRAAAREGLIMRKDRRRGWNGTGGFDLIEPSRNIALGGGGFKWTAKEILRHCNCAEEG